MEILESEVVQGLADDLGLTANDTIGELIEALQDEEADDENDQDEVA